MLGSARSQGGKSRAKRGGDKVNVILEHIRKQAGITQQQAAVRLHMDRRQYQRLEHGQAPITPEVWVRAVKTFGRQRDMRAICNHGCPVGKCLGYVPLNNVDLSLPAIITKYRQEAQEANDAMNRIGELVLNKRCVADFTDVEMEELWILAHEVPDLAHVLELFLQALWAFMNIEQLIQSHNQKCYDRRYADNTKPDLVMAG